MFPWPNSVCPHQTVAIVQNTWMAHQVRQILILQPFRRFTYVIAHYTTLPSLYLRHGSFYNPSVDLPMSQLILQPSVASPTSQLILQPFRCFTYVTAHSPTLPSLFLRHSSFSSPSVVSPTSQLILQPFRLCTYVTAHSSTLPLLHLRHSSFFNLPLLHLRHRLFTYDT